MLEHVSSYKYLGLTFNFNGKFNVGIKQLKEQGRRAMMSLLQKSRLLQLPLSTQLELFNYLVRAILTYSCEVWGYNCIEIIESLQLEYLKYILHVKKSTPNIFVYGETGQFPLSVHIHCRMVKFWRRLCNDTEGKFSSRMLGTLLKCHKYNIYDSEWLLKIKQILDDTGLSFVWHTPRAVSYNWLDANLSRRLKDAFIQGWAQKCNDSNKTSNYPMYKTTFEFEKYLDNLPDGTELS